MTTGTPRGADDIRRAIGENRAEPEGAARNARAERLAEEAERSGDRPLLVEALFNLLIAYNYSSESDKKFVPFARVLKMWDEDPADFDRFAAHSLHWYFKWVSSGLLDQPHIPLAAIQKWQAEMAHRYRLAGYSERAVRQGEFRIARHIGDLPVAERAYAAWQSADRDRMSDCHACELHLQGEWQAYLGQDEQALESWQPVLGGELTCAHEPHAVLASSLLPLLRLGRSDEARAHHLRGYRMVRTMESMRASVARHIEFCALSGNEARGLEILAQHPAHFTTTGDPDSLMDHLAVAALLTARLCALGHGDQQLPGPDGTLWTATALHDHAESRALDLAARFDGRNGTDAVSTAVRARMSRGPLLARLPLGVRAPRLAPAAEAPVSAPPVGDGAPEPDLTELVAEARRLTESGNPGTTAAWAAVESAAELSGTPLDAKSRAEVADHAGMAAINDTGRSAALFARAAALFEEAQEPGEAAACRARGGYARALSGETAAALADVDEQCALLRTLHGEGRATLRQLTGALLVRSRVLARSAADAADQDAVLSAAADQAAEIAEQCRPHTGEAALMARQAEATAMLGRFAAGRGDHETATELLTRAVALYHRAGRPWYAADPESVLADLSLRHGQAADAVRHGLAALDHGGELLEPAYRAQLHLLVAQAHGGLGDHEAAASHALDASQWADEADDSEGDGATARLMFGGALRRLGRTTECVAVLESVLPDLVRCHGEGDVVQARWWIAECQLDLGEAREAAEQFLLAATIAEGWEEPHDHAMLANLAADALSRAPGLTDQAVSAYARAEELWREIGDPHAVTRTLRARGWLELREGRGGPAAARPLMDAAAKTAAGALAAAPAGSDLAAEQRFDLADTQRQTAELLVRSDDALPAEDPSAASRYVEAVGLLDLAVATLAPLGDTVRDRRTAVTLMAGWLELDLSRPAAATARARSVTAAYEGVEGSVAEQRREEAATLLAAAADQDPDSSAQ
ncbi:tetratricopeptide repeat protein [Streptomyces sp. NBC_01198]|uniref:tetratricopeptide repeat protein n=1 Tax=Streptomyces sp. NBC_01198 TaxID=2903769 RepID=UPI002E15A791|nr:tetratricopeptide repeat protein [Streptomyces sp. NBC_01198]